MYIREFRSKSPEMTLQHKDNIESYHVNCSKTKNLSVSTDDAAIQLLYRNTLDIRCKHTASDLHDKLHVP